MGNAWKGISDPKMMEAQHELLQLGGLSEDEYNFKYISLGNHEFVEHEGFPPEDDYI